MLPTTKTGIDLDPNKSSYIMYGPPGSGKTTMANSFGENMLFLYADPGVKVVNAYKMRCTDWKTFKDAVIEYTDNPSKYDGVVVDTIDWMYEFCIQHFLESQDKDHLSELEWSKGWDMVKKAFGTLMPRLMDTGKPTVLLSHSRSEEIRGKKVKTMKLVPGISGMGRKIILRLADACCYIGLTSTSEDDESPRKLLFEPTVTREGKNRLHFNQNILIHDPKTAFKTLLKNINVEGGGSKKKTSMKKSTKKSNRKRSTRFKG